MILENDTTKFCDDEVLDMKIRRLHRIARLGLCVEIQTYIDTYLPAVGFLIENPGMFQFARKMVLCVSDSPQEGHLPDLGPIIRSMLSGDGPFTGTYALKMLYQALPSVKKGSRKNVIGYQDYQTGICILSGLLLGLYPDAVKFPPFGIRVWIYVTLHKLLTHGNGESFCKKYPMLMTLAFMEYCAYVIPKYLPAEYIIIKDDPGMGTFFSSCHLLCDTFRQELLNDESTNDFDNVLDKKKGNIWDDLEFFCSGIVGKHIKNCKSKNHSSIETKFSSKKSSLEAAEIFSVIPRILPYSIHHEDDTNNIMASELGLLDFVKENQSVLLQVVSMQQHIQIFPLPYNLIQLQIKSIQKRMNICERSAMSGTIMYLCLMCMNGQAKGFQTRGQCRLDVKGSSSNGLVCSICQNKAVISIGTLGRLVNLCGHQYYMTPCCCSVQLYTGCGDEFAETMEDVLEETPRQQCRHRPIKIVIKNARRRCEICSNIAAYEAHSYVNHLTGQMHVMYLCPRHTPCNEVLKYIANYSQFMIEVIKRDKPLFALKNSRE